MNVTPLNEASVSPEMIVEQTMRRNPQHIVMIAFDKEGVPSLQWSSMPFPMLAFASVMFHRVLMEHLGVARGAPPSV